jgi:hypothetical protein
MLSSFVSRTESTYMRIADKRNRKEKGSLIKNVFFPNINMGAEITKVNHP